MINSGQRSNNQGISSAHVNQNVVAICPRINDMDMGESCSSQFWQGVFQGRKGGHEGRKNTMGEGGGGVALWTAPTKERKSPSK